jgi:hypothetical protein
MITVTYRGRAVHIESDADELIKLPSAALGHLIDFEQIDTQYMLAIYWAGHSRRFGEIVPHSQLIQPTAPDIPYQSLFIMSIIKSDLTLFNKLYKHMTTSDLEICPAICMWQFTDQIERKESVAQGILTLFRYIRANRKQNIMLGAVLRKLSIAHIVSQVYILECNKYNVVMYNIIAAQVERVVKWAGVQATAWSTWPYIKMPMINQELPSNLSMVNHQWPPKSNPLRPVVEGENVKATLQKPEEHRTPKIYPPQVQPINRDRLKPILSPIHRQEMKQCIHLNPTLKHTDYLAYERLSQYIRIGPALPGYYIHNIEPDNGALPSGAPVGAQDSQPASASIRPVSASWPM